MSEQLHTEARCLACLMTDMADDDSDEFFSEHITIQYRPTYRDWVTWDYGCLEGVLRGNDLKFSNYAKHWLQKRGKQTNE